jgi:HlyD family secretion protein
MRRTSFIILLIVIGITVSLAAFYRGSGAPESPAFLTAPVVRGDLVSAVDATGTLEAVETVEVGSQVSGTIRTLLADFNDRVQAGEVIARLEPSLFEAQVEQSKASLLRLEAELERARVAADDAEVKLRRARELWDMQLLARADLEAAEATARTARTAIKSAEAQLAQGMASLNQSEVNLSHTVIRAPIDGIVISRDVDVGQTVAASMSAPVLFVIARDLSRMRVNARIDEADIGRVAAGQPVTFTVDAYPGRSFTGRVSQVRLQAVVESNVVSYVTIIDVHNPDLRLKPGMTATVAIEVARADDVFKVPASALRFAPDGSGTRRPTAAAPSGGRVWVLREGQLHPIDVTAGLSDGSTTAVAGDLHEGMRVVTATTGGSAATSAPAQSPLMPFARGRGGRSARP